MKPRLSLVTLAVADLEQALIFYRGRLGLPSEGIIGRECEHGAVAFFDLPGGVKLAFWAQNDLAFDTGLPIVAKSRPHGIRSFFSKKPSVWRGFGLLDWQRGAHP